MFSTLVTVLRGRSERAHEGLVATHATVIIEQKLREASEGHERSKHSLATLILRERNDAKAIAGLAARIADLETRTAAALTAGLQALAEEGAQALADLENEKRARDAALERTRVAIRRLRLLIEKIERRLIDLRQGLITAQALETERRTTGEMRGHLGAVAALGEAEAVLKRTLAAEDPIEALDVLDQINAELSGDDLVERMAAHGLGPREQTSGEDVLDRLRTAAAAREAGQTPTVRP